MLVRKVFGSFLDMSIDSINMLIETDRGMTIPMTMILTTVVKSPGCTTKEIMEVTNFSQATVSRSISALSKWDRKGNPGLGLLSSIPDPTEGRRQIIFPTEKGIKLMVRIFSTRRPFEVDRLVEQLDITTAEDFLVRCQTDDGSKN